MTKTQTARIGKNMHHALVFALKYPGWHSYAKDQATVQAIKRLAGRGLVQLHPTAPRMFKRTDAN